MPPPQTGMRTAVGTSAGGSGANAFGGGIREGKFTEQIYTMIRDQKYHDAVAVLSTKVLEFPNSRAATSLLAYCYYHVGDFQNAIGLYERLTKLCPENNEYKFHYAQALFKAGLYEPAVKACQSVADVPDLVGKVQLLQVRTLHAVSAHAAGLGSGGKGWRLEVVREANAERREAGACDPVP